MSESSVPVIGIDLGTTNSCVAIYLNGRAEVLANEVGERTTPSYVGFKDEEILVGKIAKDQAYRNYGNTIFDVKRLIGKTYNDIKVQEDMKYWPFGVINRNGKPEFKIKMRHEEVFFCPEQISAIILEKLKDVASKRVEAPVTKAVITVPAYFNNAQRQATKDAGNLAGLEVLRLLNEPTAAAIAYALDRSSNECKHAIIFDLGGGTFDVSIIEFKNQQVTVKAIDGDTHLGGDDFDNQLFNYLVEDIKENFNFNIKNNRRAMARLLSACERTKQLLSFQTHALIELDGLIDGDDYHIEMSRAKFEDLNEDLFQRTLEIVKDCVESASLLPSDINSVVLVGGSTKIPRVRFLLESFFDGKELSNAVNPDEAVALGAAIQAAHLSEDDSQVVKEFNLKDVVPHSLGVETAGGLMNILVKRNTVLPATARKTFTTALDDQTSVNIKIFEGEKLLTKDNDFLSELKVNGIIPAPAGVARIDETFFVDMNGMLSVTAVERSSGKTLELNIEIRGRLPRKEIERLRKEASQQKEQSERFKKGESDKNELETYCIKTLRLIRTIKMSFNDTNHIFIRCEEALAYIMDSNNEKDFRNKLKELKAECDSIVEKYQMQR